MMDAPNFGRDEPSSSALMMMMVPLLLMMMMAHALDENDGLDMRIDDNLRQLLSSSYQRLM